MLVERLVLDFPFAAGFKEREKVRVSIAIPVLEFDRTAAIVSTTSMLTKRA